MKAASRNTRPTWAPYVRATWRYSGWTARATTTSDRPVIRWAMRMASAVAEAPSYMEALLTSIPVSWQTRVWYSKSACSVP